MWPSKEDIKTNTVVVLVTVAIAAVVMILLDAIFGGILGLDHRRLRIILKRRADQNGRTIQ